MEMLREPVILTTSRLINVQGRTEAAKDTINNITKYTANVISTMMGAYEDGGVGEIRSGSTSEQEQKKETDREVEVGK